VWWGRGVAFLLLRCRVPFVGEKREFDDVRKKVSRHRRAGIFRIMEERRS